jgi:hypothetical protein
VKDQRGRVRFIAKSIAACQLFTKAQKVNHDAGGLLPATLSVIFHGGVEQRSGARVRRLVNIEPNETATHRFLDNRL